jgi:hypothetical protein
MSGSDWLSERGIVLTDIRKAFGDEFESHLVVHDC